VKRVIPIFFCFLSSVALGWGELGHHMISRLSGRLVAEHPLFPKDSPAGTSFAYVFQSRRLMLGHLSNVPDSHWRSYDQNLKEEVNLFGDPTHYFEMDRYTQTVPLDYEKAKVAVKSENFFKEVGSLPWRAQQFYDLYVWSLKNAPKLSCEEIQKKKLAPARDAQAFAGLLAHFTEDVSMPLHATSNFDGVKTSQKGIHWYFESDLVDELEMQGLEKKVLERALALMKPLGPSEAHTVASLRTKARELYPESEKRNGVAALMLVLLKDSLDTTPELLALDKKHGLTNDGRKHPSEAAPHFEPLIIERLALSVAVTTDLFVRGWIEAGSPEQCYTWDYALKPAFVSPTDPICMGYALKEPIKAFKKKNGKIASDVKLKANSAKGCLRL